MQGRTKRIVMALCLGVILCGRGTAVYAEDELFRRDDSFQADTQGRIVINYQDSTAGNAPVRGAEFTFYRVATLEMKEDAGLVQSVWEPVIESVGIKQEMNAAEILNPVHAYYADEKAPSEGKGKVYRGVTDHSGNAVIDQVEPGIYLAEETKPAEEYLASAPFVFSLPYGITDENNRVTGWKNEFVAEPKAEPGAKLQITKKVEGNGGDKKRGFSFQIKLSSKGSYACQIQGKERKETKEIGDGDLITLRDGDKAVIDRLPVGCSYQVTEKEANQEGYKTTVKGAEGKIRRKLPNAASFVNRRDVPAESKNEKKTEQASTVKTGDVARAGLWTGIVGTSMILFLLLWRRYRGIGGQKRR